MSKDSIISRINFIKTIMLNKELPSLLDFNININTDDTDTAITSNISNIQEYYNNKMYDIRKIINKKTINFVHVITTQIGGKLSYVKSGTTGHTFYGKCNDINTYEYAIKVVAYPKKDKGSIYDARRPENAEIMILKILSYFILYRQTPHIVLPIATFYTNIGYFTKLIDNDLIDKTNKKYNEFIDRYEKNEYHDDVSILISEWANNGDLLDFIKKNYLLFEEIHWKVIFFQILSTLSVIQSKFPSFRHNDLKANNILVHKIDTSTKKFTYTIMGDEYKTPNIGYHIKIWDFDFSSIGGLVENQKVNTKWTNSINITSKQNKYYDIHYFFNTLMSKGFFPEFQTDAVPLSVREFVDRVLPKEYRKGKYVHERGRILINTEHTTPYKLIKEDIFFNDFRNYKDIYKNYKNLSLINNNIKISDIINFQ